MAVEREVRWSDDAVANVDVLQDFIRRQWSEPPPSFSISFSNLNSWWSSSPMAASGQLFSQDVVAP